MKKVLLFFAIMMMAVTSAFAEWTKPALPQGLSIGDAEESFVYFVNVETGKFFNGMKTIHDWNTTGGVDVYGLKIQFNKYSGLYNGNDMNRMLFRSSTTDIHVDHLKTPAGGTWSDTENANFDYKVNGSYIRICTSSEVPRDYTDSGTRFWGVIPSQHPCHVYANANPDEAGNFCDWIFITPETYAVYQPKVLRYYTAVELGDALVDVTTNHPAINVSAEQAVYDNEESTTEQLRAATVSVLRKMWAEDAKNASFSSPLDFTKFIINPSFEEGNLNGWTVNTLGDTGVKANIGVYTCSNTDGNFLFNTWDSNRGYPISQTIQNLPKGVYKLEGYVASDLTDNVYLFADGGMKDANNNVINSHKAVNVGHVANTFTNGEILFAVEGGTITIGASGGAADGSYVEEGASWYKADNFRLTYYGNQADSYNALLTDVAAQAQALLNGDGLYNEVKNALQAAINEANQATTSSKTADEKFEILKNLYIALNNAKAGVELSKELSDKIADLNYTYDVYGSSASQEVRALKETLISQADNYKDLTTDQIKQLINDMNNCRVQLVFPANYETATTDAPINVTPVIYSPSFVTRYEENSLAGWQGVMPNRIDGASAECYESIYNMYQPLEYLPAGNYKVKVRAFFRYGFADQDAGINKDKESLAKIYAQTSYTADGSNGLTVAPVKHLYEGAQVGPLAAGDVEINFNGETKYVPNTFDSGSLYIRSLPSYENVIDVIVAEDGKLTIGIKQDESVTGGWMMMSRWELYYCGPNPEAEVANLNIALNDAGYATFSCKRNVNVSGVEAYKAAVEGETITLTKLEGYIPAGTGVLFYSEDPEAEVNLSLATSGDAADVTGNALKATTKADGTLAAKEANSWALGTGNQFLSYTGDAFIHNRAYLVHEKTSNSIMRIVFEEAYPTGIDAIVNEKSARENKFLEDGKIVIVKNGAKYNVAGQVIK